MDNLNKQLIQYTEKSVGNSPQKIYRVQGAVMFGVALGLLVMRLIVGYLPIENYVLMDVIFSIPLQVGILVVMPFLVYTFVLKMNVREILRFSNFKRTKWYNAALALPIGICVYCATIGISGIWQTIIAYLGYTHSSASPLPVVFNPWLLVLNLFLTAVLPGICEEFCNRGGFLTVMKNSFPFITTIIIMGVSFGLFHQNITQVFYTTFFGAFAAFLTLKLKSVWPAVVLHFTNNAFSVFNEFSYEYGWLGGGLNGALDWGLEQSPLVVMGAFIVVCAVGIALTALLLHLNSATRLARKKEVVLNSGYDHTNKRIVLIGEENPEMVRELGLDKEVYGAKLAEPLYKPTLKDNAFYIGAIVIAVLTTVFTFIFGFVV